MAGLAKLRLWGATALAFALISSLDSPRSQSQFHTAWLVGSDRAAAQSSGGRFREGSFDESAAPPESGSSNYESAPSDPGYSEPYPEVPPYSSPSRIPSNYPRSYPPQSYPYPNNPSVIVVPQEPTYYPDNSTEYYYPVGGGGLLLLPLLLGAGIALPLVMNFLRFASRGQASGYRSSGYHASTVDGELHNDTVTVTKLQVALLAQARHVQEQLSTLTANTNAQSRQGLAEVLRESVLALLRSPENWTHVQVSSQTVNSRPEASRLFEQLSVEERSKFNAETLVNVGGQIRRQAVRAEANGDPAAYIVVTLLIGTADDRPLFDQNIYSADDLRAALQKLGGITPEYLLIFELLWSPQDPSDSLSRDELLSQYPNLVQIA